MQQPGDFSNEGRNDLVQRVTFLDVDAHPVGSGEHIALDEHGSLGDETARIRLIGLGEHVHRQRHALGSEGEGGPWAVVLFGELFRDGRGHAA